MLKLSPLMKWIRVPLSASFPASVRAAALLLILLLADVLGTAATAASYRNRDFVLLNRTGIEIHELYVSPHDGDDWQEDVLGGETLPNGASVKVRFSVRERADEWDIKVVDGEEESLEWTGLDLTRISQITLYVRNGQAYAEVK